ncbi:DNase I-like protein [Phanerochaete sordida]|uniref:DNA-(apurinic or apyrimidinic site) endonuclease n=1 Tax=Phanerochaete sordida TaxID=48140 RepID=A0A9P3GAE3_9APHY|nr:DNase I-like protein [Phanerochaete sordida]
MRILSWNINGIRTLPQYHPWNTMKSCEGILDEVGADIICFQEMKSSRAALPKDVAIADNYTPFFSFPVSKGGYSGVAVYTKSSEAVPLKAEEGLSGRLQPKPSLTAEERISPAYPSLDDIVAYPAEDGSVPETFDDLDSEGRGLVLDFGLFVLINVYCPNETSDARLSFKMNYHLLLAERVRRLISEGREVIVLGDMNICATPLDHCDGHLSSVQDVFWEHPARQWFHRWLGPDGPMVDVVRTYWPERKGMFTCWNMRIQARETNYGTRVDYILVTKGLLKWIKHGDIQPSVKGSDHCPIYIDLHDEILLETGATVKLRDAMKQCHEPKVVPRLSAKSWEEFSGKQTLLSTFFGKKGEVKASPDKSPTSTQSTTSPSATPPQPHIEAGPSTLPRKASSSRPTESLTKKRSLPQTNAMSTKKKQKKAPGQQTLGSFFSKPTATNGASTSKRPAEVIELDSDTEPSLSQTTDRADDADQLDADYQLACELAASQDNAAPSSSPSTRSPSESKAAWASVFAPVKPPNCTVHGEPARKYTVNKPGPNKGRTFYLCSRPVGPGYDKGKGERLRHEVNYEYRCNYFKWASDVKRDASAAPKKPP